MTSRCLFAALMVAGLAACSSGGNVFTLKPGTCYQMPDDTESVSEVEIVECSESHDLEVYHTFDMADGEFPGVEAAEEAANSGCKEAFDTFVGMAWADSKYDFATLYPTEETWAEGDREIVCAIGDPAGRTTGSLKDIAA